MKDGYSETDKLIVDEDQDSQNEVNLSDDEDDLVEFG